MLSRIQTTLNPFSTEVMFLKIIGIKDRDSITIKKTSLTGVKFFLLNVLNPIQFTESFELKPKAPVGNLDKVLIVTRANIDFRLHANIKAYYQLINSRLHAMVDNLSSGFAQVVPNFDVGINQQPTLLYTLGCKGFCSVCTAFSRLQTYWL
ncbi:hypothetical protein OGM63_09950 [Plectonema radiosum NIES-515]|uniref:Uncharacterized protein n=1 Tax=Plectonema radiosum NIES-515 TaxID=2986073 RepID=A0ABT3AXI1_9CYAN|nr:hypothetical protein [Plectonema radiosum]MCV3213829.1 hypothetical protein [Plectonema radiosum NIES-515]